MYRKGEIAFWKFNMDKLEATNIQWDRLLIWSPIQLLTLIDLLWSPIQQLSLLNLMCYKGGIKIIIWLPWLQMTPGWP